MVLINRYCLLTRRFLNKSWHSTCVIQRCSSSIRSPIPPFSPSLKTNTSTQSFDAMIDSRREQARRTVLIHVDFTVPNKRQNRLICFFFSLVEIIVNRNCINYVHEVVQSLTWHFISQIKRFIRWFSRSISNLFCSRNVRWSNLPKNKV